ncbi:MAG: hypothetical protein HW421_2361 [Ignavibacteria bacterium]|nr:hypothetical protein [Ignavibacteria bacterium]
MKFLANENFPEPSILILKVKGFEVFNIRENCPGIPDEEVIELAQKNEMIILTFDRDYGEIIYKYSMKNPPAVIYFRNKGQEPDFAGNTLISLMDTKHINFENKFTVIEKNNIRQRNY